MSEFQNKLVGVIGRKGSGKSTCVKELLRHCPRILVWDPMKDHAHLPNVFQDLDDLIEFLDWASGERMFAGTYVSGSDLEGEFDAICDLVYDYGWMLFVVEEAPLICKAGYLPPAFGKMVRTGRHQFIDMLWTAQRASEVSRTLTSATDFFIFYSQTEPRDLDAIAERCEREVADRVANLGLHDSFVYDVIERQIMQPSPRLLKRDVA